MAVSLAALACLNGGRAFASSTCSDCHNMPPLDAAYRNLTSGGFVGSHSTHNPAVATATSCEPCHTGASSYLTGHRDGVIQISSNLNASPVAATYSKGTFFNQTSIPVMGSCSNVNCHFEAVTPSWGSAKLTSPTGCATCHGAPPSDGNHPSIIGAGKKHGDYYGTGTASCVKCHSDHTLEATPFAHATSAGKRALMVGFLSAPNSGGAYSGNLAYPAYLPSQNPPRNGSCTALYCHSNGAGGAAKVTPVWGSTLPADCSGCHDTKRTTTVATTLSGKHDRHMNPANNALIGINNGLNCIDCHAKTVSSNTAIGTTSRHVNGLVDYSSARGGGSAHYNAATKSCSSVYCHSNGNRSSLVYVNPPAWNSTATLSCNGCHGTSSALGAPDYASGGTASGTPNSHAKHLAGATSTTACAPCHAKTVSATSSLAFKDYTAGNYHLNGKTDVTFLASRAGAGASWNQATTTCSSIYCHGGNSIQWGAAAPNCQDCHGGGANPSVADFSGTFWSNGTLSTIQMTGTGSWADTGHGRPAASGNYPGSGNAAANFTGIANYCEWCHDSTISHGTATNPFRLRNFADPTWGLNGACMICHATGSAGVTVSGVTRNGSTASKVGSFHYGAKHTALLAGGQFCWDCHDPHGAGSTNQFMIRQYPALTSDTVTGAPTSQSAVAVVFALSATPTGTDYAKSTAPFNGICNVCHTTTSHYTTTAGDSHNAGLRCTSCHNHTGDAATTAFKPTNNCDSCHGYPPAPTGFVGTHGNYSSARNEDYLGGAGAHLIAAHINPNAKPSDGWANCAVCHSHGSLSPATHTMVTPVSPSKITVDVSDRLRFNPGLHTGPQWYNGVLVDGGANATGSCLNVACHFKASKKWSTEK
ncbi:CxxxxCH/CxxCH domain-containing protein [Geomonas sp. Red32]|uniref:CxxxxCH/CxxCH domain c-type cytochrome n=1 Tax=Geomonas sp. Red32 TaxID=2912856 RepID=UPI002546030C|nr:CxxxxCH/CxxCH domain-containing protein [Geomonas sp. Red32]